MKTITTSFALLGIILSSFAQQNPVWTSLEGGLNPAKIYTPYQLLEYNNNLYGAFQELDTTTFTTTYELLKWNGTSWTSFAAINTVLAKLSMVVFNNTLYVSGGFTSVGGSSISHVAKWNGTAWSAANTGLPNDMNDVGVMCVYNNELYLAAKVPKSGSDPGPVPILLKWTGSSWTEIARSTYYGGIETMVVYNNNLFVAGKFEDLGSSNPYRNIARWSGSSLNSVGDAVSGFVISDLCVNGTLLYAAGSFDHFGTLATNNIASWNNQNWAVVGSGVNSGGAGDPIQALASYNSMLYVGGTFPAAGGKNINKLARWDGSSWWAADSTFNMATVDLLYSYQGALIVGGLSVSLMKPNRYLRSLSFQPTGIDAENMAPRLTCYPNPNNGNFTITINKKTEGPVLVKVFDFTGRVVFEENKNENTFSVQTNNLTNGAYVVLVQTTDALYRANVVINR